MWGDFNLPDINWTDESLVSNRYPIDINKSLLDLLESLNLTQVVHFPTRANNTLDILLTNRPTLVHKLVPSPGISDHDSIVNAEIDCMARIRRPVSRKIFQWHKLSDSDLLEIRNYVNNSVESLLNTCSTVTPVEDIWLSIKIISSEVTDKFIPSKMTSCRFNQPWVNRKCRSLFRQKQRAYNRALRTNKQEHWDKFSHIRKETQKHCNLARSSFLANQVSSDTDTNRKNLYKLIKNTKTDNSGVSTLVQDGKTLSSPKEKANALNRQFSSVFSPVSDTSPDLGQQKFPRIQNIVISVEGVKHILRASKPNKSSGPDNIPAKFLKETADELAPALTLLFQASINQSKIPSDWRHARVAPLYKTGKNNRSKPANYRPISLTSLVCKAMEHIVCSHLMGHLDKHNILSDFNHAFRKKRSCESQLILTVNDLAQALDKSKQIDCILLDFAKAFDKVSHKSLLAKLSNYGVDGHTLMWIEDFLHARTQVVVVDGEESDVAPVTSGVPQGTVLGPALFLVYINDLPEGLECTPRLFADDCLLYRVINSKADTDAIQRDLLRLESWERQWSMEFAEEKCQVLTITRKLKRNIVIRNYEIHNHILDRVNSAAYLGIILDSKLTFNQHINSICKKANSTRQFLRRTLSRCDRGVQSTAYKTFVRPIVEYSCSVWDPHHGNVGNASQADQLEAVQNKAARSIYNNWDYEASVSHMRRNLEWETLQARRAHARLCLYHKVKYSLVAIPLYLFPTYSTTTTMTTRGAVTKLVIPRTGTLAYRRTFMIAAPLMWNKLLPHITHEPDPEIFRGLISEVNLTA